jgi:hypothetical protein
MPDGISERVRDESRNTQLHMIRDLMLTASRRGAWLTLGEIAVLTEIGEASISAQLRHLRKRRHGRHVVEKRRRMRNDAEAAKWEYRVTRRRDDEVNELAKHESGAEAAGQIREGGSHAEAGA